MPDEVTSVGRIMQFPPFPDVPEPLRGNAFALVEATVIGDPTWAPRCSSRCAHSDR